MSKGGPFRIVDVPKPIPEPNQVLIRQSAVALNDLDRKQRDWGVMVTEWPHVLGLEGAGVVEAVGSDVSDFQPGDEVFAWGPGRAHGENWGGTFQKYVVIPAPFCGEEAEQYQYRGICIAVVSENSIARKCKLVCIPL